VVLSKADLVDDPTALLAEVERIAVGAPILTVSAIDGRGIDEIWARIGAGRTVAFVGSSGVGKSTLLNVLAGETRAAVKEVREDDARGRHTTTRRQLHVLPDGGLVLDTPGMRELALWDADGVEQSFPDIDELVSTCRFSNCQHNGEPGCAIAAALANGTLKASRYEAWLKLEGEARHQVRRVDALARAEERRKWKAIGKSVAKHMEAKYGPERW
jgi:ribosome biogenesis GTPase